MKMARKSVVKLHAIYEFFTDAIKLVKRGENAYESKHVENYFFDGESHIDGQVHASMKDKIYNVEVPVNPAPFIKSLFGKKIAVKLKWGMEYRGVLSCADAYMNLQLREVEEYIDDIHQSHLDKLMIRCNNILFIRKDDESETSQD